MSKRSRKKKSRKRKTAQPRKSTVTAKKRSNKKRHNVVSPSGTTSSSHIRKHDWLLLLASGAAVLFLAKAAVVYPQCPPVIGIIVGLLSVGSLFSPNTPVGHWLYEKNWPSNQGIEKFYVWYRRSMVKTLQVIGIISIYSVFSIFSFMHIPSVIIMFFFMALAMNIFMLFRREKTGFGFLLRHGVIGLLLLLGTAHICHEIVSSEYISNRYTAMHDRMIRHGRNTPTDLMALQVDTVSEYRKLWFTYYNMSLSSTKLMLQYKHNRKPLNLWDGKIPASVTSRRDYIERQFKINWKRYENALASDRELIDFTKSGIEDLKSRAEFGRLILPPELEFPYLSASLIHADLQSFTSFSVVARVIILPVFFSILDQKKIFIKIALLIALSFACYYFSWRIGRYNNKHDPSYNGSQALFFVCLSVISLAISWWTF